MTGWGQPGGGRQLRLGLMAAVVLAATAIVLATGLLAGCSSETSEAPSEKVQAMLTDYFAARNAGDGQAMVKLYATSAILDNYADGGNNVQGAAGVAGYFANVVKSYGMQWAADGEPVQYDRYIIQSMKIGGLPGYGDGTGAEIDIFEIDSNDQIAHQWIVGWIQP